MVFRRRGQVSYAEKSVMFLLISMDGIGGPGSDILANQRHEINESFFFITEQAQPALLRMLPYTHLERLNMLRQQISLLAHSKTKQTNQADLQRHSLESPFQTLDLQGNSM